MRSDFMKYSYLCISSTNEGRTAYGIAVYENCDGKEVLMKTYEDISNDAEKVEQIVEYCNRCGLDICHLEDVIEDFLTLC